MLTPAAAAAALPGARCCTPHLGETAVPAAAARGGGDGQARHGSHGRPHDGKVSTLHAPFLCRR